VRGLLSHDEALQCDTLEAVAAVRASGAIEQALGQASAYAAMAARHLRSLPPGPQRDALHDLTRYVVERRG
jgi:geranylgeranyl pyrophosphate synthase